MDVGREIAAALAGQAVTELEDALQVRRQLALQVLRTIPSGTLDADLTSTQAAALDEYETVGAALTALREENES